jgi:acylglycerol lipase
VQAGKLAAVVLPRSQLKQKLDPKYMSRSPKVCQEWSDDPLCHDTGTLEGLKGLLQRAGDLSSLSHGGRVPGLTAKLPCPLWLGHGSGDKVVSYEAAKRLFHVLIPPQPTDKTFRDYPGAYHKLHAEPEGVGEQFAKDVAQWILTQQDRLDQVGG